MEIHTDSKSKLQHWINITESLQSTRHRKCIRQRYAKSANISQTSPDPVIGLDCVETHSIFQERGRREGLIQMLLIVCLCVCVCFLWVFWRIGIFGGSCIFCCSRYVCLWVYLRCNKIWKKSATVVAKNMDLDNIMGLEQRGAFANQTNLPDVPGDINISNTNLHP